MKLEYEKVNVVSARAGLRLQHVGAEAERSEVRGDLRALNRSTVVQNARATRQQHHLHRLDTFTTFTQIQTINYNNEPSNQMMEQRRHQVIELNFF